MSAKQISPLLKAWYQWKSLRLPWRNRFLVGLDLQGNTYWEFRLRGTSSPSAPSSPTHHRLRRIVQYPRSAQLSEVRVPPAWHQWLRHRRDDAPTLSEQAADAARQERMRVLAAEADARWAAKPSLLEMPGGAARGEGVGDNRLEGRGRGREVEGQERERGRGKGTEKEKEKEDPWKRHQRGGPSETWQPAAWTPSAGARRR
ncbi:hypothetical protein F4810DRAFT_662520 [Camillea tinctor]|nr:hypothetical protein F4810DRAFT_662520 [Camillea tinctor]